MEMQRYFLITCDQGEGLAVEEYSREGIEAVLDEITDGVKILEELPTAWQTWLNAYRRSEQDGQPVVVIRGEVVVPQAQERAVRWKIAHT